MATKLSLVLKNQHLALALRAAIFAALLFLVWLAGIGWIPAVIFIAVALFLYFQPVFNTFSLLASFLILLPTALMVVGAVVDWRLAFLAAAFFGALLYLILSVKNLTLINRTRGYLIAQTGLLFAIFLLFFVAGGEFFILKAIVFVLAAVLLNKEFFVISLPLSARFGTPRQLSYKEKRLILLLPWLTALVVVEILWVVSVLPINFINSALMATGIIFAMENLSLKYLAGELANLSGKLNRKTVMISLAGAAAVILFVLAVTKWVP